MRAHIVLPALAALCLLPGAAVGQDRPGRYAMSPVENGFVRLDTETGAVSLCSRKDGTWKCEAMEDEAMALRQQVERLTAENRSLRSEVERLEKPAAGQGRRGELPSERPGGRFELPSDQEVDRALDYLERMYRKFRDRLKQLEGERKDTPL
jgi:hypothetical protein